MPKYIDKGITINYYKGIVITEEKVMFDANMCWLKKGEMFFAEVHCIDDNRYNIRAGDAILCEMLDDCHDDPRIKIMLVGNESVTVRQGDLDGAWLVYGGNLDGTGFISDHYKGKAMPMMKFVSKHRVSFTWNQLVQGTTTVRCIA